MGELVWRRLGYQRCHKCNSLVPKDTLTQFKNKKNDDESIFVCRSCSQFKCFECGKRKNIVFYSKLKLGGSKWLCSWCAKLYGVVIDG
jgi:RNase P subunit RPR2